MATRQDQLGLGGGFARRPGASIYESEDQLHFDTVELLRIIYPPDLPFFHVPNGENRGDKIERTDRRTGRKFWFSPSGAKLKRMGTLPGVYDLLFVMPNAQLACIELKLPGEGFSDAQADLAKLLRPLGVVIVICTSLEDVERTITKWLAAFGRKPLARITA